MKTMCPPGYDQDGIVASHALIYALIYIYIFFYILFNVDLQYSQYQKLSNSNINQIYILTQIDRSYNEKYITFSKNM